MQYFFVLPLLSLIFFFLPKKILASCNVIITAIVGILSSYLAINVLLTGSTFLYELPISFWGNNIEVTIDSLSALFIIIINFTVLTGAWFAIEYINMYIERRKIDFSLHFFSFFWLQYSMLLVCMFHHTIAFLVAWEIMSVASFLLVIFENEKPGVLKAGIDYLVQMHIGALFLIIACIISYNYTGQYSWEGLSIYFFENDNVFLFMLFFIGFGIKAGFMPLHTWLPHAHPAAPSHVSGIMSGVMIKMGIYGILRVLLHIQTDVVTIGVIILIISLVSGIAGVATAIIQHDMKKLLAYHSIENIGIIGIGIGTGLIGVGTGNNALAILGFGGGILHILNHSLFKSLLFYSMGSVYSKTHTRNIDKMGGLIKKMPHTTLLFLIASIAICGLPPFNGFVSEFFIYNAFAQGMIASSTGIKILMMFAMLSLVVIGGLAIFCFTKAFGITFLGYPRHIQTENITEVKWYSLVPQYFILALIVAIGIYPELVSNTFFGIANLYIHKKQLIQETTVINTKYISWFALFFIGITALIYFIRKAFLRNKIIEQKPTWGCGYVGSTDKMQYTASSYSENYYCSMDKMLNRQTDFKDIADEEIFPEERSYESHSESITEERFFDKITGSLKRIFNRLAFVQTGQTQHYIMYMFVLLIVLILLTILNII